MKIKTTNYEAVSTAAPINRDAAVARDGSGEAPPEWIPPPDCAHWKAPPKTFPVPENAQNRIGEKHGDLTVVGYYGSGKSGSRWLVRCHCGSYEIRTAKALRPKEHRDQCQACNHALQARAHEHWRRTGRRLSIVEFRKVFAP